MESGKFWPQNLDLGPNLLFVASLVFALHTFCWKNPTLEKLYIQNISPYHNILFMSFPYHIFWLLLQHKTNLCKRKVICWWCHMDYVTTLKYTLPQDNRCYQYEQCWKFIKFEAWTGDVTIRENLECCVYKPILEW